MKALPILFFTLLLLLLLLLFSPAQASELSFTLASKHVAREDPGYEYQELNPGFVYTNDKGYFIGGYVNSYAELAPVIGKRYTRGKRGLNLGLAVYPETNAYYHNKPIRVVPIVQLSYDIGNWRVGYTPIITDETWGIFTIQFVMPLDK